MGYLQNATMVMVFLLGIILSVLTSVIDSDAATCNNRDLQNANKGVLVIAVLAMVLPITYTMFNYKCKLDMEGPMIVYVGLFLLLGVTLIGLGATISMNAGSCKKVKGPAQGVWAIGTIFTVLTLIYIGLQIKKKYSGPQFKKKSKKR